MHRRHVLIAAIAALPATMAYAHGPSGAKVAGANGGDLADVENGHLEFVAAPDELRIFLTDLKDVGIATEGLTGRVVVQHQKQQSTVQLVPRAPNLLVAPLTAPLSKGAIVVVSTSLAKGGKSVQARFVVR